MRKLSWLPTAIAITIILIYWAFRILMEPGAIGWEFHQFYGAGKIAGHQLYNAEVQFEAQKQIWEENLKDLRVFSFGPFLKPAYYRLVLVPLATLPFWTAYKVWVAVQFIAFGIGIVILARRFGITQSLCILIPLCPHLMLIGVWGQDPPLVFMLVVISFELLLRGRSFAAGGVLALALVKWNIFLLLPLLFLVRKQWKTFAGFSIVALAEIGITLWISGASAIQDNISMLHLPAHLWDKMAALRGLLLMAKIPDQVNIALMIVAAIAALRLLRRLDDEKAFAVGLTTSIFLAYHTMGYDVLFLFVPIFVFQKQLQAGWMAGVTVFLMSPIPQFIGMYVVAILFLIFLLAVYRLALYPPETSLPQPLASAGQPLG